MISTVYQLGYSAPLGVKIPTESYQRLQGYNFSPTMSSFFIYIYFISIKNNLYMYHIIFCNFVTIYYIYNKNIYIIRDCMAFLWLQKVTNLGKMVTISPLKLQAKRTFAYFHIPSCHSLSGIHAWICPLFSELAFLHPYRTVIL